MSYAETLHSFSYTSCHIIPTVSNNDDNIKM